MGQARSASERPQWLGQVVQRVHELLHGVARAVGREEGGRDGDHDDQCGGGGETEPGDSLADRWAALFTLEWCVPSGARRVGGGRIGYRANRREWLGLPQVGVPVDDGTVSETV